MGNAMRVECFVLPQQNRLVIVSIEIGMLRINVFTRAKVYLDTKRNQLRVWENEGRLNAIEGRR
jgi:hypothetical protein